MEKTISISMADLMAELLILMAETGLMVGLMMAGTELMAGLVAWSVMAQVVMMQSRSDNEKREIKE